MKKFINVSSDGHLLEAVPVSQIRMIEWERSRNDKEPMGKIFLKPGTEVYHDVPMSVIHELLKDDCYGYDSYTMAPAAKSYHATGYSIAEHNMNL